MNLFIQIPCFNESRSLPVTLAALPKTVPGFRSVSVLVIDDGSTDGTSTVARAHGVTHVIRLNRHQGLARAFATGLEACTRLGADVIVNTDADNQYNADDIIPLTAPIVAQQADIVIGARPIKAMRHFSSFKRLLQYTGSAVVRALSGTPIKDATSGFRAISRDAALRINIFSSYTYTLEMLIQADQKNLTIVDVPIRVNGPLRPSRLVKNSLSYVLRSFQTIVRVFINYHPFRFFFSIGSLLTLTGVTIGIRFVWLLCHDYGHGHVQSLILAAILIIVGFQIILQAFQSDITATNRRIMEDIQYRLRKQQP